ncbi:LuxR family transcriptional regulator [Tsuneonella rigui]|uniref:LuxR family transcriptional regulator n=1 Tax=Tsuneonella rigui TaxID=1708790 RepID=UPI000F7D867B|nr:LuxR family transcriptional regulator [Tsuneonella rigui]
MNRLHLQALDAIHEFGEIDDAQVLLERSSQVLKAFGYSAFVLSRLPRPGAAGQPEILLNGWPEGWSHRYDEAGHYNNDPVASYCAVSRQPFSWTEIPAPHMHGRRGLQIVNEASEFGLTHGLCVPVHTPLGTGGMSLAGQGLDEEPGVRDLASLLAFKICMAFEQVGPDISPRARLTPRERDVLSWIAMGKTVEEVGMILSISGHTVGEHLKRIRAKLHTSNNAHSVIKALQTGQLQL